MDDPEFDKLNKYAEPFAALIMVVVGSAAFVFVLNMAE